MHFIPNNNNNNNHSEEEEQEKEDGKDDVCFECFFIAIEIFSYDCNSIGKRSEPTHFNFFLILETQIHWGDESFNGCCCC